jgi:hypothetical protein
MRSGYDSNLLHGWNSAKIKKKLKQDNRLKVQQKANAAPCGSSSGSGSGSITWIK